MMGQRQRLVLLPQKDYKEKILRDMLNLIERRWVHGKDTLLCDVQNVFQKPPYNLSDRTVRLYLSELVERKKLTTWRKGGNRYYAPKISMPIKVITTSIAVIIFIGMLVDLWMPQGFISKYIYFDCVGKRISTLPLVIYSIIVVIIDTIVWNIYWLKTERKLGKN
ncbi:MAG: hypothetical protein DRN09_00715 [Thermoplasmata archaeon]|nr:MAG: hypothetical protein DRN09_00715 [Thermoplasmata archaeon]